MVVFCTKMWKSVVFTARTWILLGPHTHILVLMVLQKHTKSIQHECPARNFRHAGSQVEECPARNFRHAGSQHACRGTQDRNLVDV